MPSDLIEQELRAWPAMVGEGDALEAGFVSAMMVRAADALAARDAKIAAFREALQEAAAVLRRAMLDLKVNGLGYGYVQSGRDIAHAALTKGQTDG